MVLDTVGRHARRGICGVGGPLDVGGGGAGGNHPVVARAVGAVVEAHLHAVFERQPVDVGDELEHAVPAAHARVEGKKGAGGFRPDGRREVERERVVLGAQHLDERAGAPFEFVRVVGEFDPSAGQKAQHVVAAQRPHANAHLRRVNGRLVEPAGHHGRVVAAPLEKGRVALAAGVDFDAVQAVFEGAVAAARRHDARIVGGGAFLGAGGHLARGRARGLRPRLERRQARRAAFLGLARHVQQAHLPDGLGARGRVGAAECDFADGGRFEGRQVALPHVEIGEKGAGRGRAGVGAVGLLPVRADRLVFGQHAVHVHAACRQQEVAVGGGRGRAGVAGPRGLVGGEGAGAGHDAQAVGVEGRAHGPERVGGLGFDAAARQVGLLVPVGVELHAPLLHEHAAVMVAPIKGGSGKVAFHGSGGWGWRATWRR